MNKDIINKKKTSLADIYGRFGIFIILIIAFIVAAFLSSAFLNARNLMNIVRQNTTIMILACGAMMVLISGEVDLSPGSVAAFSGCMATIIMMQTNSIFLAVVSGLAFGAGIGLVNGLVVTKCGIPSFIMTLATQSIVRGAILAITDAKPIKGLGNFTQIGQGYVGPIPIPVIILILILILTWFLINKLPFGRHVHATGGNREAARASGINVDAVKSKAFIFQGLMAGLSGIILMARVNSGQPTGAIGYEFQAITAAIIGGTSMSGGVGNVYGTIAGSLFVGILVNIMTLMNVSTYYQDIVQGAIIAIAVITDVRVRKMTKR